jgi:serine/threonine protein kinase
VDAEPEEGGKFGEFALVELIGRGSGSVVYRAGHPVFGRDIALKLVEMIDAPRVEVATAVSEVGHPGLVPVYGHGRCDGRAWLAMRLITGVDLHTWLTHTRLGPSEVCSIVRQVAATLDALHAAGYSHGDVKPQNILVAAGAGKPDKLRTYLIDPVPPDSRYLTLDYAAPERIRGSSAGALTDQYALAAVAYECLTGTVPFPRGTPEASADAHLTEAVAPLRDSGAILDPVLAIALDVALGAALAKNPAERYGSCSGLAASMALALEVGDFTVAAPPQPARPSQTIPRPSTITAPPDGAWVAPPGNATTGSPFDRPEWAALTGASPPVTDEEALGHLRTVTPAEVARSTQPETTEDAVDCSIFAPPATSPGNCALVQVFAHLPKQADEAATMAAEFDEQARRRAVRSLEARIGRGERLTFELTIRGIEVPEPVQELVWLGRPAAVQFEVIVPQDFPIGTSAIGRLVVSRHGISIGYLKFTLRIEAGAGGQTPEMVGDDAERFTRAFVSYASQDRAAVLSRLQILRAVGIAYFQDVDMDPGQRWETELYRQIDGCDLFLLFWSQAAKDSQWVRREVQYALGLGERVPEIRPVVIEGPPVPPPWEELAQLHFDDRLLALLAVAAR